MLPLHAFCFLFVINSDMIYVLNLGFPSLLPTIIHYRLHATPKKESWAKPPRYFFHSIFLLNFHSNLPILCRNVEVRRLALATSVNVFQKAHSFDTQANHAPANICNTVLLNVFR